jgi:L-fucose mutarotase/ribose pyranase (RbsD/FucU family)
MKCPVCIVNKFIMVVSKTRVRRRSFYALCSDGHFIVKSDNSRKYGGFVSSNIALSGMIWVNQRTWE